MQLRSPRRVLRGKTCLGAKDTGRMYMVHGLNTPRGEIRTELWVQSLQASVNLHTDLKNHCCVQQALSPPATLHTAVRWILVRPVIFYRVTQGDCPRQGP